MKEEDCWARLKLEPTEDMRAIKRAYAHALKAIDVDQEPTAFASLRNAFEQANDIATYGLAYLSGEIEEGDAFTGELEIDLPANLIDTYAEAQTLPEDDPRAHLVSLLFDAQNPDEVAIESAVNIVLSDPRMEQVDFAISTEHWLAELLVDASPKSDPAIVPAINAFHWQRKDLSWDRHHAVARVIQRYNDRFYLHALTMSSHAYHTAYKRLSSPAPTRWSPVHYLGRPAIRNLLAEIRSEHPTVEWHLDTGAVSWWEKRSAPIEAETRDLILKVAIKLGMAALAVTAILKAWPFWTIALAIASLFALSSLPILFVAFTNIRANAYKGHPDRDERAKGLDTGWLAGLPILALLASLAPLPISLSVLIAMVAIALAALATKRGMVIGYSHFDGIHGNRAFYPMLAALWWGAGYFMSPAMQWWQATLPMIALCWAGGFGVDRVDTYLRYVPFYRQRILIAVAILFGLAAASLVFMMPTTGVAAFCAWFVGHYALTARLPPGRASVWSMLAIGLFLLRTMIGGVQNRDPNAPVLLFGCMLMILAVLRLLRRWRDLGQYRGH